MENKSLELSSYYSNMAFIRQTAEQIIKDFGWMGITIRFSGNATQAYEELFEQIEPVISNCMQKEYQKFLSILYRIDLEEKTIRRAIADNASETVSGVITDLILRRELQKVVIRNLHRNKLI